MNRDTHFEVAERPTPCAHLFCTDERLYRLLEIELAHLGIEVVDTGTADRMPCLLVADTDAHELSSLLAVASAAGCRLLAFGVTDPGVPAEAGLYLRRPFPLVELEHTLRRLTAHASTTAAPLSSDHAVPSAVAHEADSLTLTETENGSAVAVVGERRIPLTPTEAAVLRRLCDALGEPVSREALSALIGGGGNSVDVYICHLRRKIEKPLGRRMIATVRGQGYVWSEG